MLLGRPLLKNAKVSHDQGTNIITILGTSILKTILVIKKLGVQTKRPMCSSFYSGILYEKEVVMFAIKVDLFSTEIITIPFILN